MNNSVNHSNDLTRIDLVSFDLRSEGREVAFTSYFDNEEKQNKINSFTFDNNNYNCNYSYEQSNCNINLKVHKSVDKLFASVDDILTYKIMIDNLEGRPAYNVILQDNLPAGTTYIINSLRLNGYQQSGAYPQLGFLIQRINPNSRVIITFEVSINSGRPLPKEVGNFSTIIVSEGYAINTNAVSTKIETLNCYEENNKNKCSEKEEYYQKEVYEKKYCDDISLNIQEQTGLNLFDYCTEQIECRKKEHYLNLSIIKVADRKIVEFNNVITYKIDIKNNEEINLFNIQLVDFRDEVLEFVRGSLIFNGRKINVATLDKFMNIGDLASGEECRIEYKMKVRSTTKDGYIRNSIYAKCSYSINQKDLIEGRTKKCNLKTKVRAMSFKTYNFNRLVEIQEYDTDEISIEDIDIDVTLGDKYVLMGKKLKDNEGKILSGYQLKFFGTIDVLVQYSILNSEIEVRVKAWSIPFSSYLVLPPDYEQSDNIDIQYRIEDSAIDILNCKVLNLGTNILFYL
ncbi:MAG: DUF11 domain-containing protein [Sarcina sp.]